jgi:carotenoid cleavage dioxygenase
MASDTPAWTAEVDNPYLHGIHAPVVEETTGTDLEVEGELPSDLYGAYLRNGPSQIHKPMNPYHWFDGDGLMHGVYFHDGRVDYRSRFVRTDARADEQRAGRALWPGVMGPFDFDAPRFYVKDTANTDVIWHDGNLIATWYLCGQPYLLDPRTLEDRGKATFGGKLTTTVSAHPKVDERTGELVYFTLGELEPPYMTYGVVSKDGELVHEVPIDLPGARAPHELNITENYTILHDLPFFHDVDVLKKHHHRVTRFHRDLPSRYGVIPRRGSNEQVRWFEFEPGYVLHMCNAWEEGDWIVIDGCFQPDPTIAPDRSEGPLASMLAYLRVKAHLHRWRMNLVTGETWEGPLDDLNVEFCLPDTALYGVKTRYSYHQYLPEDMYTVEFRALVKYDHEDGSAVRYDYPDGWLGSESPFAPRVGATHEDDGYVITIATNVEELRSECWVFDARQIDRGPIARSKLPSRVPSGFHAKWVPGDRIF